MTLEDNVETGNSKIPNTFKGLELCPIDTCKTFGKFYKCFFNDYLNCNYFVEKMTNKYGQDYDKEQIREVEK